jgi:ABC-2 type transport system permease protein
MISSLAGTGPLVRLILRRDRWLLPLWILALGLYPLLMVFAQESVSSTAAERLAYVAAIESNSGFLMLYGPAYGASVGALGIWAAGDALWIVGLASLLTVIRHTRAEEEVGRSELLGATVVGRQASLAATLIVVFSANLALAVVATLTLIGKGLPPAGSIALGLSLAAVGWTFAAVAAVAAQLTESASAARGIAVAGLGAAWLLRAVGDAGGADGAASWLSWLSPIGWARRIRPFAGERWWLLALGLAVVVVLAALAAALAARRDLGAGVLRPRLGPAAASPGLGSPVALAWRLHRSRMLAWAGGLALLSGVLSASASSADDLFRTNRQVGRMFELVGAGTEPSDVFLSAIMGMFALLVAGYAVQATLRLRSEETGSRVELLLATSAGRMRWVASHLVFSLLGSAVVLAAAGLASGLVYGLSVGDVGGELPRVLAGALVQLPAVWVLVGVTVALFGLRPRLAWAGWAPLAAFVLLWTMSMSVQLSQPLLDVSPFNHVPRLPGGEMSATPLLWLVAISAVFVVVGLVGFRRRDIMGA